jgi:hypothetical protein
MSRLNPNDGIVKVARDAVADYDAAEAAHRATTKWLAIATHNLRALAPVAEILVTAAIENGRGPVDAWGDSLYNLCKTCGRPQPRFYRDPVDGERIGVAWVTEKCSCKRRGRK